MFDWLRRGKKEAEPVVDIAMQTAKSDCLKIVQILRQSTCISTMQWDEMLVKFKLTVGVPEDVAIERLVRALNLLKKSGAVGCAGIGSEICFSRTTPIVVI